MVLPAAERAAYVPSIGVLGPHQERNPAMSAADHASLQPGIPFQLGVQFETILLDNRLGAIIQMPIRPESENPLQGYGKKAKFSITMRIVLCIASLYRIKAEPSRGRERFFCRIGRNSAPVRRASAPCVRISTSGAPSPACPARPKLRSLLGRKKLFLSK